MNVLVRLGVFALVLASVFAGAYGVGAIAGPAARPAADHPEVGDDGQGRHEPGGGHGSAEEPLASGPGGLAVSTDGYTLRPVSGNPRPGLKTEFAFQILDEQRAPVTRYQFNHEKQLHLIVVRRDLTGFQHLHPQLSADGTWRTPLTVPGAGDWRVFADFLPEDRDRSVILGVDVPVPGGYRPAPLPAPATTVAVDGYEVTVEGDLVAGRTSRLTLRVARAGAAVTDLQPYLGASGHLVALRVGDLGYLHVHPEATADAGPAITFDVEVPTAGEYRLFLDFQHGGVVRTASFTATAA